MIDFREYSGEIVFDYIVPKETELQGGWGKSSTKYECDTEVKVLAVDPVGVCVVVDDTGKMYMTLLNDLIPLKGEIE